MNTPQTFVLVHGGWHGGWCWKKVTPLLRAAGHHVCTPTLTGLGERSHLLTPQVGLDTHIQDIVAVLEYEDFDKVVLVGHSYAGMVITGVAQRTAGRLAQLVYLDAFFPEQGKALQDYGPPLPTRDDGWRIPAPSPQMLGVTDEGDVAWMAARLGDQPLRTFMQPAEVGAGQAGSLRQSYVQCTREGPMAEAAERAKQQGVGHRELLNGGHETMVTQPEELVAALLELVASG
jgi:pimeloyl-ACP methyl ester carboxylesterase